nr:MAG TPA: hypothetical protein [Caudoviricetes sp.]
MIIANFFVGKSSFLFAQTNIYVYLCISNHESECNTDESKCAKL